MTIGFDWGVKQQSKQTNQIIYKSVHKIVGTIAQMRPLNMCALSYCGASLSNLRVACCKLRVANYTLHTFKWKKSLKLNKLGSNGNETI